MGFAPDRGDVKEMVYQFVEKLKMKHPFSNTSTLAGNVSLNRFSRSNSELSMNRNDIRNYTISFLFLILLIVDFV